VQSKRPCGNEKWTSNLLSREAKRQQRTTFSIKETMFNSQAASAMASSSPQSSQHHRDSPRPSFGVRGDSVSLGRQVRFAATLVSSPVLHSNCLRLPNDRPLLTGSVVEGLAGTLTQLLRVDEDAPMTTTTTDPSTNGATATTTTIDDAVVMGQFRTSDTPNNNTAMATESTIHEGSTTAVASPLGRRESTMFIPKSKKQVVVKRSARLNQSI